LSQQLNDSDGSAYQERYHEWILRKIGEERKAVFASDVINTATSEDEKDDTSKRQE
jgi:hypothetical protein